MSTQGQVTGGPPEEKRPPWQFSLSQLMVVTLLAAIFAWWFRMHYILGIFFSSTISGFYLAYLRMMAGFRVVKAMEEEIPSFEKQLAQTVDVVGATFAEIMTTYFLMTMVMVLFDAPSVAIFYRFFSSRQSPEPPAWILLIGLPPALYCGIRHLWRRWPHPTTKVG